MGRGGDGGCLVQSGSAMVIGNLPTLTDIQERWVSDRNG